MARRRKSPSSPQREDQSTVGTVIKSTADINAVLNPGVPSDSAGSLITRSQGFSEARDVAAGKFAVMAWRAKNPEANLYLNGKVDQYVPGRALYLFSKWLGRQTGWQPPVGLTVLGYALKKQGAMRTDAQRGQLEDLLLQYLKSEVHGSFNYKVRIYSSVHGLFKKHRVNLPNSSLEENITVDSEPVEGSLSLDEIRKIVDECKPREAAIFKLKYQGLMDNERFLEFNQRGWAEIKDQLASNAEWIKFSFPRGRKKNKKRYYVVWHKDWDSIKDLKKYLAERGEPKPAGVDDRGQTTYAPIFLNNDGQPYGKRSLETGWLYAATRAGIVTRISPYCPDCKTHMRLRRLYVPGSYIRGSEREKGYPQSRTRRYYVCPKCQKKEEPSKFALQNGRIRYGKNLHEMRDVVKTVLTNMAGVPERLVDFFMGHQVDPLYYNKILALEKITGLPFDETIGKTWTKAEPFLNLWSRTGSLVAQTEETRKLKDDVKEIKALYADAIRRVEDMEKVYWPGQIARVQRGLDILRRINPDLPELSHEEIQRDLERHKTNESSEPHDVKRE